MDKQCSICGNKFSTLFKNKNICSFSCAQERNRRNSRISMRAKRHSCPKKNAIKSLPISMKPKIYEGKLCEPCLVCGFSETTDIHHEGDKTYVLCPNHHALITRNIKTINDYDL